MGRGDHPPPPGDALAVPSATDPSRTDALVTVDNREPRAARLAHAFLLSFRGCFTCDDGLMLAQPNQGPARCNAERDDAAAPAASRHSGRGLLGVTARASTPPNGLSSFLIFQTMIQP